MTNNETMMFKLGKDKENKARDILVAVYAALKEKGYNPINQIIGYILSETPPISQIIIMRAVRSENWNGMSSWRNW